MPHVFCLFLAQLPNQMGKVSHHKKKTEIDLFVRPLVKFGTIYFLPPGKKPDPALVFGWGNHKKRIPNTHLNVLNL
jgi:hypothetical protein